MLGYLRKTGALAAGCLMLAATAASAESGATQKAIAGRGALNCGVSSGVQTGMSTLDSNAKWSGFEVDFCRAVAAATLGDADKIKFVPLEIKTAFATLQSAASICSPAPRRTPSSATSSSTSNGRASISMTARASWRRSRWA